MINISSDLKTFIVTGGCGFIGSHICEELLKQNKKVYCVDNLVNCEKENVNLFMDNENFIFVEEDIRNLGDEKYVDMWKETDMIFHEACGKCTVCMIRPDLDLSVNAWGTFVLLELAVKYKLKKFIHASTGSVYGEPQYFPSDEKHPLCPTSYYGVSKLAGERYVEVFGKMYGLNYSILRYYHVYGSRQVSSDYGGVVAIFIKKCLKNEPITIYGTGEQLRSFTYVKDIVNANFLCATDKRTDGEIYNACSGVQISIQQLCDMAKEKLNCNELEVKYDDWRKGDIKYFKVSNKKISDLGITFQKNFSEVMDSVIEEYKEHLKDL